ncbi:M61 family metallopeptidase [Alicycliphilus denitrificans]|uniref:Peptidase M61 domain protein n=1 Tax=Alicycliphilus denitrificans (strain DSM 14773 / CIP 107495 / K601) TaxID=596154 RepID=F4GFT5_ALIDK|nr:M61 family metallopeptidase [Alicycliphilus denitrificans]AEB86171.1 peptidase M61 domain protein [Alicycliphilus denitrificans K601]
MPPSLPAIHYRIDPGECRAHLYRVTLTVAAPAGRQELSLPVWIPGSYLVREFSKNLQSLRACQGGAEVPLAQLDKHRWVAQCRPDEPLVLSYAVAAYDNSVRTAWLDATRGFFNATSLCLRVHGQEDAPHGLEVVRSPELAGWSLATGLAPTQVDASGFGSYTARDYDELADCPVEMGPLWTASFSACGVPHRLVVAGAAPSFDGERLVRDMQRICEEAIRFWHGAGQPPFDGYLFMLNAVNDGYGGLEHRNSTALICSRRDLPRLGQSDMDLRASEGYTTLLGLVSHEYFHAWNVKRLRPAEFARYDYARENYTELLWFFEGFTSYYDDLLLRRAGLIDHAGYLKLLTKAINQVLQTPGRLVQSVAQASFDAWIKYYRQDENTPNATVSYYTKGALVALCLDLALRREGRATLDDAMRALWQRTGGGPMAEADVLAVLQELSGRDWSGEITQWAHGTTDLPLAELLAAHGITLQADPAQTAQRLGLRVAENGGIQVKTVLRGGAAEAAGFMAGDEWLALEAQGQAWRLLKLDELLLYAGSATEVTALVARDRRLLRLPLALPAAGAAADTVRLDVQDAAAAQRWLGAAASPA